MTTYRTHIQQRRFNGKLYVLETIRDLDEAIDQLCDELGPEAQADPFAEDLCPYFGILWPAAQGLAEFLSEHPELVRGKSVIELGCGLGLPTLVAHTEGGRVLATDFHPDVEAYFLRNCRHSNLPALSYRRFNWRDPAATVGTFDVVMGSDIIYESKHPQEVAAGLLRLLEKGGVIILADQGRNYLPQFLQAMGDLHTERFSVPVQDKNIQIFVFRG